MRFLILGLLTLSSYGVVISDVSEYPQLVMLSFDGPLEQTLYEAFYSPLFNLTNPDQCNIGITFFVSHDYTNYTLVHDLWHRGHEIASHSISQCASSSYWLNLDSDGWASEMYGMKEIASNLASLPLADIVGSRSPYLPMDSPAYLQAIHDTNFAYDSSMTNMDDSSMSNMDEPIFPYELDMYPGLWEIPINALNATYPCSLLDSCTGVNGVNATFHFLLDNFRRFYSSGRVPFGLFTHASWFETDPTHYPGYSMFLEYLGTLDDVYVVTLAQALAWVKQPTKLVDLPDFEPWDCVWPQSQCQPVDCHYQTTPPGGERFMASCVPCPPNYPWVNDPYGNNTAL